MSKELYGDFADIVAETPSPNATADQSESSGFGDFTGIVEGEKTPPAVKWAYDESGKKVDGGEGSPQSVMGIASESDKVVRAGAEYIAGHIPEIVTPVPGMAMAQGAKGVGGLIRQAGEITGSDSVAQYGREMAEGAEAATRGAQELYPLKEGSGASDIRGGLVSTAMQAPFMVASAPLAAARMATAATAATLAPLVAITEGDAYDKYRNEGFDPGSASLGAGIEATIEGATEFLPLQTLLKTASPVVKRGIIDFVKSVVEYGGEEFVGEALATLGQDLTERAMAKPGSTLDERQANMAAYFAVDPKTGKRPAWENFKSTMVSTATQTLIMGGIGVGSGMLRQKAIEDNPESASNMAPAAARAKVQETPEAPSASEDQAPVTPAAQAVPPAPGMDIDEPAQTTVAKTLTQVLSEPISAETATDLLQRKQKLESVIHDSTGKVRAGATQAQIDNHRKISEKLKEWEILQQQAEEGGGQDEGRQEGQGQGRQEELLTTPPNAESTPEAASGSPVPSAEEIDAAAHEAATSPQNDLAEPTEAQAKAGNYKKGHVKVHGLDISIENPSGSERSGVDPDGKPWSVTMPAHYGYIKRTEGADGDHVDVYVGTAPESDQVFVVDQIDPKTGKFDEHKAIMGAASADEARRLYEGGFSDGSGAARAGAITPMSVDEFKSWLKDGDTKSPISQKPAAEFKHQADILADEEAARFAGKGLDVESQGVQELIEERRKEHREPDPVTGLIPVKHFRPTLERAWKEHSESGRDFVYSEIDVRNLGGLNAAQGTSGADKHLRAMADIVQTAVKKVSPQAQVFRKGGDEFGVVAPDANENDIDSALAAAQQEIILYAEKQGLNTIPHPKAGRQGGTGISFASRDFKGGTDLDSIRGEVDLKVESVKKESKDVDKREVEKAGAVTPGGQAGRTANGTGSADKGGRQEPGGETGGEGTGTQEVDDFLSSLDNLDALFDDVVGSDNEAPKAKEVYSRLNLVKTGSKRGGYHVYLPRKIDKSIRATLEAMASEIAAGEAGTRLFFEGGNGEGGKLEVIGQPSTFPDYFKDKGYTKEKSLKAIEDYLGGKGVTEGKAGKSSGQIGMLIDLVKAKRAIESSTVRKARAERIRRRREEADLFKVDPSDSAAAFEDAKQFFPHLTDDEIRAILSDPSFDLSLLAVEEDADADTEENDGRVQEEVEEAPAGDDQDTQTDAAGEQVVAEGSRGESVGHPLDSLLPPTVTEKGAVDPETGHWISPQLPLGESGDFKALAEAKGYEVVRRVKYIGGKVGYTMTLKNQPEENQSQILTEMTEAGEQVKMFATPPKFGKKEQKGDTVSSLDFSIAEEEPSLFDEAIGQEKNPISDRPEPVDSQSDEKRRAEKMKKNLDSIMESGTSALKTLLANATDKNRLGSGLVFDDKLYLQMRPHMQKMWAASKELFGETKEALVDFIKKIVAQVGPEVKPYVMRFGDEIKERTWEMPSPDGLAVPYAQLPDDLQVSVPAVDKFGRSYEVKMSAKEALDHYDRDLAEAKKLIDCLKG